MLAHFMACGTPVSFVSRWISAARLSALPRGSARCRRGGEGLRRRHGGEGPCRRRGGEGLRRRGCRERLRGVLPPRDSRLLSVVPLAASSLRWAGSLLSDDGWSPGLADLPRGCTWPLVGRGEALPSADPLHSAEWLRLRLRGGLGLLRLGAAGRTRMSCACRETSSIQTMCRGCRAAPAHVSDFTTFDKHQCSLLRTSRGGVGGISPSSRSLSSSAAAGMAPAVGSGDVQATCRAYGQFQRRSGAAYCWAPETVCCSDGCPVSEARDEARHSHHPLSREEISIEVALRHSFLTTGISLIA